LRNPTANQWESGENLHQAAWTDEDSVVSTSCKLTVSRTLTRIIHRD